MATAAAAASPAPAQLEKLRVQWQEQEEPDARREQQVKPAVQQRLIGTHTRTTEQIFKQHDDRQHRRRRPHRQLSHRVQTYREAGMIAGHVERVNNAVTSSIRSHGFYLYTRASFLLEFGREKGRDLQDTSAIPVPVFLNVRWGSIPFSYLRPSQASRFYYKEAAYTPYLVHYL